MAEYGFNTVQVRGGYSPKDNQESVAVPVYATAAFDFVSVERAGRLVAGEEAGFVYTRIGNPTNDVLERRIAALDHGVAAVSFGSGMAAISSTILAVTGGSGRILSTYQIYGGAFDLEKSIFPNLGIHFDLVSHDSSLEEWEKAITEETKAIYVESISNPTARLLDFEALAKLAHKYSIPLIVDNTFATPYLFQPLEHGADIVVYSATKALNGHGNAIGGLVVEGNSFHWSREKFPQFYQKHWVIRDLEDHERSFLEAFPDFPLSALLRLSYLAYFGAVLSPYEAQLILIGVETLSERVKKQVANTRAVLSYLEKQSDLVSWVSYPEAKNSPDHKLAKKYFKNGAGSVLSFGFNGTEEEENRLIEAVQIFGYQANVGDARSLIVNSPKITHGELRPQELQEAQIAPETVRLSFGLEEAEDLIADLDQAFEVIRAERKAAKKSA